MRDFPEIAYCVLSACLNGALRSHLVRMCNLNSRQVGRYTERLLDSGLLEVETGPGPRTELRTTVKGRRYIETYYRLLVTLEGAPREKRGEGRRDRSFWTGVARLLSAIGPSEAKPGRGLTAGGGRSVGAEEPV